MYSTCDSWNWLIILRTTDFQSLPLIIKTLNHIYLNSKPDMKFLNNLVKFDTWYKSHSFLFGNDQLRYHFIYINLPSSVYS